MAFFKNISKLTLGCARNLKELLLKRTQIRSNGQRKQFVFEFFFAYNAH